MINRLTDYFGPTKGDSASATQETAELTDRLQDATCRACKKAGAFVAAHPLPCLGVAAAAGIALGWWVKRK